MEGYYDNYTQLMGWCISNNVEGMSNGTMDNLESLMRKAITDLTVADII